MGVERTVRELGEGDAASALAALHLLRPRFQDEATLESAVRRQMREGYRLLAAFVPDASHAVAVAGFRVAEFLAWGRTLYVDDLSTLAGHRGAGHARALLRGLEAVARDEACEELHLDSGVGPHRAQAHTLYHVAGMHVSALHFRRDLR